MSCDVGGGKRKREREDEGERKSSVAETESLNNHLAKRRKS